MEKDKRVIAVENSQSLARIEVQIGLVNKVLSDKEDAFLKPKQVVLRCETREGFKDFVIDANINELDLNGNQLISISVEIGQLTNLKKLNLGHNFLTKLSPEIAQLLNLEELNLTLNELKEVPIEIVQLVNLKVLNLESNQLKSLPRKIGQLINLELLTHVSLILPMEKKKCRNLADASRTNR